MNKLLCILMASFLFTSCYSYKIYPGEYRNFTFTGKKETAYVINPELKKENEILKQSGIFEFTNDSLDATCLKIKLHPLKSNRVCGEPILLSAITVGQFPVYFPDRYQYQFDEINKNDTTVKHFELQIAQRYWFWDMFVLHKNFKQKAGKSLLANYYKKESVAAAKGSLK